jgi:hypothetical protein
MAKKKKPRSRALLTAQKRDGTVIERLNVSLDDYYDGQLPIIDSNAYRKKRSIRLLKGELFGPEGNRMQASELQYDANGKLIHSRAVYDNGTIIEN